MAHFYGVFHGNCALRYVGGVLVLRKLDFIDLIVKFGVKKANFRGLIAKNGHYWPILSTETHLWPNFMDYAKITVT